MERPLKPVQPGLVSLCLGLDPAVWQVANETTKTFTSGRPAGKESESDALYAAFDEEMSCSNH